MIKCPVGRAGHMVVKKALVVDRKKVMRFLVMTALKKTQLADFEFLEAENGQDAWELIGTIWPDIIFLAWSLDGISGLELVRKIRSTPKGKTIPLVMVTAEKSVPKVELALAGSGVNAYIMKPFSVKELTRKIEPLIVKKISTL
jgi:DNA-binding response OmpR family regulator